MILRFDFTFCRNSVIQINRSTASLQLLFCIGGLGFIQEVPIAASTTMLLDEGTVEAKGEEEQHHKVVEVLSLHHDA